MITGEPANVSRVDHHRHRHRGGRLVVAVDHAARAWPVARRFIQREGFTFYAPITTGILVSVALSLILWLFSR